MRHILTQKEYDEVLEHFIKLCDKEALHDLSHEDEKRKAWLMDMMKEWEDSHPQTEGLDDES